MHSTNPTTGKLIKQYDAHDAAEAAAIIEQADTAFGEWKNTDLAQRAELLHRVAKLLEENKDHYAGLMSNEMGKVFKEGVSEIEKCAWVCHYYAEHGAKFLANEPVELDNGKSFVTFQPLGVILAVMPWNFPFWQVFRFAAPTLMAGNAAILKHASNVCGCALEIEKLFKDASAPENLFRTVLVPGKEAEHLIQHPKIQAVTLTGSTEAGRSVARIAGEYLKKTVLELGGSDPYIILEDANIEAAAAACTKSRMINAGQSCIAAKRFIVVDSVYETFLDKFLHQMQQIKMGNPLTEDTDIGPQASIELRDNLHKQVMASIGAGATCILGGTIPKDEGAFYPPTVLVDVPSDCPAYHEEMFGPVASIIRAKDREEAIQLANDSSFGLGSAVFTRNVAVGEEIAEKQLHAGACFVNDFVKSDPRLPFGGIKQSGYGRELSLFGIREFVNIKAIYVSST